MAFAAQPLPRELDEALATRRSRLGGVGRSVHYFETIGSTNDIASALAETTEGEGAVVIADTQTAGRGRRGRTWFSPPGAGLYVSVVLVPGNARVSPERATALLTLAAGVALSEAVQRVTGLAPSIKWPNDLLVGRRKLAGILAEGVARTDGPGLRSAVLGYGLNVMAASCPPDLASIVTSLEAELGRPIDRAEVFAETLASLAERYGDLIDGRYDAILDAWRARAFGASGARVEWTTPEGVCAGTTEGIDAMGALLVRRGGTVERIVAGDVRWRLHAARD